MWWSDRNRITVVANGSIGVAYNASRPGTEWRMSQASSSECKRIVLDGSSYTAEPQVTSVGIMEQSVTENLVTLTRALDCRLLFDEFTEFSKTFWDFTIFRTIPGLWHEIIHYCEYPADNIK